MSDIDLSTMSGDDRRLFRQRPLHIASWDIGNEMVSPEWHQQTMCNHFWRAYITDKPGVALDQSDGRVAYTPDVITVIPAWVRFTFHADTTVRHAFIHSTLTDWSSALTQRFFPRAFSLHEPSILHRFQQLVRRIDERDHGPILVSQADGIIADIIAATIAAWTRENQQAFWQATRHQQLDPVLIYIEDHLHQGISIAEMARLLSVGPDRCIRLFKEKMGQTPTQYILERRVVRACDLLSQERHSLDGIARRCGFGNRRYLSRMFHRRMGVSPSVYRQRFCH